MQSRLICASHSPLMFCRKRDPQGWDELQASFEKQRRVIDEYDPDLVVAFCSDHFNGQFLKMMPAFCIGFQAEAADDIGGFPGPLDVPAGIAMDLAADLRHQGVDTSVSYRMVVDHALSQTLHLMLGGVGARPVIPIFINCITQPFVPYRRARILGEAVARFCAKDDKKVLFLASGGMSHHPVRYYPAIGEGEPAVEAWQISGGDDPNSLTRGQWLKRLLEMHHEGAEMIVQGSRTARDMFLNDEADRKFLDIFVSNELETYDSWIHEEVIQEGGIGSMELITWLAAASAHRQAGGGKPVVDFYGVTLEIGIAAGIVYGQ